MVVITGAAGFIGSNLAHRLWREFRPPEAAPLKLLLVDHPLTRTKLVNWAGLGAFDFLDHREFLLRLERGDLQPKVVFHLGACSSTTQTDWQFLLSNNVEYSQRVWNWCADRHCPLIYASSAATYGDGTRGFDDRTPPEELEPLNLYGRSKNDFDVWALQQAGRGSAPPGWAGVKFFNVYGPREAHKMSMASVVWQAYRQVGERGWVGLFKSNSPAIPDGGQRRDFVFVEDCLSHLLWLWQSPHSGGLFNSGTGAARTFLDLARAVFEGLKREPDVRLIDIPPNISKQYQNFTRADMTKLRGEGFTQPPTALEDGVAATIRSYLAEIPFPTGPIPD